MKDGAMQTLTVGRSKDCDIVIADPSVSRQHAQLVVKSETNIVLFDCESKFGTFVRRDGKWRAITSSPVGMDDNVRVGRHETTVRKILSEVQGQTAREKGSTPARPVDRQSVKPASIRTVVERDPETGEIVVRKERA
jgi:pSer/pThr/pTyr-binding forkhead associated (FHA) protein